MNDELQIGRALELAQRGWGRTSPNPMVGCVITDPEGATLAEGWHEGPGTEHAEAMALRLAGGAARGATLSCTLEPCNHFGRTPPCTEAIIGAGIARVVLGSVDPNPSVDGRGIARLREAGIDVITGVEDPACSRLIDAYAHHQTTGAPLVTLKLAASLDGRIAAADGSSTWITGREARERVHRLRAGADAVMVGAGTALTDDPRLTARDTDPQAHPPLRIAVDSSGRITPDRRLFDGSAPTLIATTERAPAEVREAWSDAGAEVLVVDAWPDGRVDLAALMGILGKRDVQSVLLEGGATLAGAAVAAGIVDRLIAYFAPRLLGAEGAPAMLTGTGISTLADAIPLTITEVRRVGDDVEVEADVHRDH